MDVIYLIIQNKKNIGFFWSEVALNSSEELDSK